MKKVLLAGTAIVGALLASPANAELDLGLGGHFRAYGVHSDNDENVTTGDPLRSFDLRRDAEVYFHGEATTDNGLTVGVQHEMATEDDTSLDDANETYMYVSGGWGRANVGSEDGAAYLLQVAAPSADSNVDGLRTYIQALNSDGWNDDDNDDGDFAGVTLDYDHADARNTDRFTYLTPKFNGFQAGVSYAPEIGQNAVGNNVASPTPDNDVAGAGTNWEDLWEVAARWDGEFQGFGISLGGGYSSADAEAAAAAGAVGSDDLETWNAGLNVAFSGFSVGGAYLTTNNGITPSGAAGNTDEDTDTWVVGAGWDNGPYHAGVTYLNTQFGNSVAGVATDELEVDRWAVGGSYTYGPGMTFRGSVAFGDSETSDTASTPDFTQVAIGTDVQF